MDPMTQLLLQARDGDGRCFALFVRAAQGEVWRFTAKLVSSADADDITQDVFVRAWKALPAFRGDSSARTWLLTIARRACADAVRSNVRRRRTLDAVDTSESEPIMSDDAGAYLLWDLMTRLPPERREAFVLTQVLGCSYAETAEICGTPVGTVRSRVARAREDLVCSLRATSAR